jgi:hypothetical protein
VWTERYASVCQKHRDVVAAYEWAEGRIALLLRQPVVPQPQDRPTWFDDTRRVAHAVISDLRAAGLEGPIEILQWHLPGHASTILNHWSCRYEGDPAPRAQLARFIERQFFDGACVTRPEGDAPGPLEGPSSVLARLARRGARQPVNERRLLAWYRDMLPCWLGADPPIRRRLIFIFHRWIAHQVLETEGREPRAFASGLRPGRLPYLLLRAVPVTERDRWRPWVRLVVADLRLALTQRAAHEAWIKWLFLIPYSVPVSRGASW